MNVAAFTDVLANAVEVQIAETTWIPVASLAGLAVLKLFAWLDRRDPRDAADLQRFMETYADAGNTDRLYESEGEELERVGYDMELAGAYLLGRDAHSLANEANRARLAEALSEPMIDSLVLAMTRMRGSLEDHTHYSAALLSGLLRGLKPLPDVGDL